MANSTGQGMAVPQIARNLGVSNDIPQVTYATQAPGNIGAFSEDAKVLAGDLGDITSRIQDRMDKIASEQGEQQGVIQGAAGDVPLQENGTIRGDAFDGAAVRTMLARHDIQSRLAAETIWQQNKDNPGALKGALQAYADGVSKSSMPQVVKSQFGLNWQNIANTYIEESGRRQEASVKASDSATYFQALDARKQTIENLAMRAENDPQAAKALATELDSLKSFAVSYGPKGAFTFDGKQYPADARRAGISSPLDLATLMKDMGDTAKENRVLGKFMQQPGIADQQRFAQAFQQEFGDGKSQFDTEQAMQLMGRMHKMMDQREALQRGQVEAVKSAFDTVQKQMENGFSPGADAINSIETQAQATGDPIALALGRQAKGLFQFQDLARTSTPAQLQNWINQARGSANDAAAKGQAPDPLTVAQVEMGGKLLTNMQTELKRDPLSWGARTGLVDVGPLDDSPASASARLAAAHAVAAHYGTPLQVLTSDEATQWKNQWDTGNPDQRTQMIAQMQKSFGNDAFAAFGDLSKTSPGIANVGGLYAENPQAHLQTARDYSIGDQLLAGKDKVLPEGNTLANEQGNILGDAYGFAPGANNAVVDTANRLYAARAMRQGVTPNTFNQDIYTKALQEASGAWWDRSGVQYGGIVEQQRGHNIVLPPNTTQDQFNGMLKKLGDADLQHVSVGGGAPRYSNGRTMTADELRDAWLISSGPGRYLVSEVNPKTTGQPSFVGGTNPQGLFEIDLNQAGPRR